ncbi:addiction module toxin, HicA family [Candidatus Jorgensenbacteria bacterium CG23_combo_of_CG06-09_8_20_14_all_54_14]|uniref:Addiction module toxin, HicA family n=1 Tax=Candidatus Jorgensenbacteria bacterium CG23_combo_of_CG06-09_8_20_14_all_54_14 TaxID=1974595 RepID=A0A2G9ZAI6_9BACT|nr:MAG: addiction module toxin, HicA family [Candidatus Jorgensenbacteria bacterium CG23_combo_of_CG06-09_8_20_14_all_54_14]
MKRRALIAYLIAHGCSFVREGARHSVFFNPAVRRVSTVPRHTDIDDFLARKICRDLGVPEVKKK